MITSFLAKDFRGFRDLDLKGLQRLNLVVGKNNAGKTSLLEALAVLCDPERLFQMPGLLRASTGNVDARYFRWLVRDGAEGSRASLIATVEGIPTRIKVVIARTVDPPGPGWSNVAGPSVTNGPRIYVSPGDVNSGL